MLPSVFIIGNYWENSYLKQLLLTFEENKLFFEATVLLEFVMCKIGTLLMNEESILNEQRKYSKAKGLEKSIPCTRDESRTLESLTCLLLF